MAGFQDVGGSNTLGTVLGLAGGILASNPARKRAEADREFERNRLTKQDEQNGQLIATEIAKNQQSLASGDTAAASRQHEAVVLGQVANGTSPVGPAPSQPVDLNDPKSINGWYTYYSKKANYLDGFPETADAAAEARKAAGDLALATQRTTGATNNLARADLDKARTTQIKQWREIAHQKLQDDLVKLKATQAGRETIARMQAAQRYALAQMQAGAAMSRTQVSAGGAMARAQMSEDERTMIAEMTALNAANGQDQTRAFETAKQQYQGELKQWETDQTSGRTDAAAGRTPPADYQQPAPVFNFSMPAQSVPSNNVIVVPMPQPGGGTKLVPIINRTPPHAANPKPPVRLSAADEVKAARAHGVTDPNVIRSTMKKAGYSDQEIDSQLGPAQGGGNPLQGIIQGITHMFTGH